MLPLTKRQEKILQIIRVSIRDRGYPPTLREIGREMGIRSTNGVSDHLRALEKKGVLRREDMKSRALRPVEDDEPSESIASESVQIPVLGRVAAGPLSLTSDTVNANISVDRSMLRGSSDAFALRVKGDSMIEAGIDDGDTIFVRRSSTAEKGDIVVARVGEEATVKRFFPERDHIRLQPENKRLAPILVHRAEMEASGFEILGVVVGLYRPIGSVAPFRRN